MSSKKDKLIMENWRRFLKEDIQPDAQPAKSAGMSMTDQTSFTILKDPKTGVKFMQELLKGGDLFQQLQASQVKTKDDGTTKPAWYITKTVDDLKNWVSGLGGGDITKGIKIFAKRAAAVGSKIPSEADGIAKKDMPFLPGPEDAVGSVEDVEDALSPGGKMNVDLFEKVDPPKPNTFLGLDNPESKEFMTGGLNDGVPNDDNIKIELGGGIVASKAIPTQSNILIAKGLGMAVTGLSGGDLGAYGGLNGEILDGHHRWSSTMLNDPTATIGTIARIDLDALGRKETLRYLTAIGNALGNKTKVK